MEEKGSKVTKSEISETVKQRECSTFDHVLEVMHQSMKTQVRHDGSARL